MTPRSGLRELNSFLDGRPSLTLSPESSSGYDSRQFSYHGHFLVPDVPLEGNALLTVDYLRNEYSNGVWFSRAVHAKATSEKTGPLVANEASLLVFAAPQHAMRVKFVQRKQDEGETDYSGRAVLLRLQIKAKGQVKVKEIYSDATGYASVSVEASLQNGSAFQRVQMFGTGATTGMVSFEKAEWLDPIGVTVNEEFEQTLSARVVATSANTLRYTESRSEISVRVFISDFQVLTAEGTLIWDYTQNSDGSPGDKWVTQIVRTPSSFKRGARDREADGPLEVLAPMDTEPFAALREDTNGDLLVDFSGVLEESSDFSDWQPVAPFTTTPYRLPVPTPIRRFFRALPEIGPAQGE